MHIPKPTKEYIERVIERYWDTYFSKTDNTLSKVFKIFPRNNDFSEVLTKVVLLNGLYNTNIFNPYPVAEHIVSLPADKAFLEGAISIVEKIAKVKLGGKKRYLYSFATKYCSWHSPDSFFIYDSHVDYIVWEYRRKFGFLEFSRDELRKYERYHKILSNFMDFFHLGGIPKKKLDEFLWLEAKRIKNEL